MKKQNILLSTFLLFMGILISACKKDPPIIPEPEADIYIAGYTLDINGTNPQAYYWKNGQAFQINDPKPTQASDILISDGKMLIAGNADDKPCVWINNTKIDLSQNGTYWGYANRLMLNGTYLFICGDVTFGNDQFDQYAILWKINLLNFQVTTTLLSPNISAAYDLTTAGNGIYIVGENAGYPGYWLNSPNSFVKFSPNTGMACGIVVAGDKMYAAGVGDNTDLGIWESGAGFGFQFKSIGLKQNEGHLTGVYLKSTDSIYVYGYLKGVNKAFFSLNGKKTTLSSPNSGIYDMEINGPYTYFCGYSSNSGLSSAGYWREGKWFPLSDKPSFATAICIVPK